MPLLSDHEQAWLSFLSGNTLRQIASAIEDEAQTYDLGPLRAELYNLAHRFRFEAAKKKP